MPIGSWFIPEDKLRQELQQLIPAEDTILYTTAIQVKISGSKRGSVVRIGELAITNRGIAIFATWKALAGGLQSMKGGPLQEYIGYDRIEHIKGRGAQAHILVAPPVDSKKDKVEYELEVEQSKPHEKKSIFKRRRGQFSAVLEQAMYNYRTGQAAKSVPKPVQHPATAVRATPAGTSPRRVEYCPECGAFLDDPVSFCEYCGAQISSK